MRMGIIGKLIKKEFLDLTKNVSVLPIVLIGPFLAFMMTKLEQGPIEMMLPIWLVYGMAMVGIMLPGFTTAEEKEKGILDSLLVSPARHHEIIMSKVIFTVMVVVFVSLLVLAPNGGLIGNQILIWLAVIIGAFFFIQIGLIVAFFTDSQVSAGAFLSPAMLIFVLMPMLVAVIPESIRFLINYTPSIALLEIAQAGLKTEALGSVWNFLLVLVGWNLVAYFFTYKGIQRQFD